MAIANGQPAYPKTRTALAAYFDVPTRENADRVHEAWADEAPRLSRQATGSQKDHALAIDAIWQRILKAK